MNNYTQKWGDILIPYKHRTKNYLEIGLDKGITLPWWEDYFNCNVYGIDIDFSNLQIDKSAYNLYEINALDEKKAFDNFNNVKFDVIVDDSDPCFHYNIFEIYNNFLNKNGIYVIETYVFKYNFILDFLKLNKNYKNFNFKIGKSILSNQSIIYGIKL